MNRFEVKIDDESELALRDLCDSDVQHLFSPSADVCFGSSIITVQNISVQLGRKRFLVIDNDWADTPKEAHDYYFLSARIVDRPKDVRVKRYENGKAWSYFMDHLSFNIGKQKKVLSVEILEDHYSGEEESVRYDAGIVITLEDDTKIAIVREESITGFLQISTIPQENSELIGHLQTRLKYNA